MVVTIYENVAFFYLFKEDGWFQEILQKKLENGFKTTETISRSRAKFYRDVAFFYGRYCITLGSDIK